MIIERKSRWQEWFPINWEQVLEIINESIPRYLETFFYAVGGIPLLLALLQGITGILLVFYYTPGIPDAYESVRHITQEVPFGWWIRGLHRWGAHLFILVVMLHMLRTFVIGSFKRPRELVWIMGALLLLVTLAFGFTGYSLIGDQLSYWATIVGTSIAGSVPLVGGYLLTFMRGGWNVTSETVTRFFALHAWVLPAIGGLLVIVHIVLMRLYGPMRVEPEEVDKAAGFFFWPDQIATEIVVILLFVLLLSTLAVVFPPPVGEPADPLHTPEHIRPEWYFLPVYSWLKLVPEAVGTIGLFIFVLVLIFWPFVEEWLGRFIPVKDWYVIVGTIVAVLYVVAIFAEAA